MNKSTDKNEIKQDSPMLSIEKWTEVTKGLYRYVISAGACYEIYIIHHTSNDDILTAKANLYIVGDWIDKHKQSFFEREQLLDNASVTECLNKAYEDDKTNNITE